jgi:hypothetical protein
MHQLSAHGEMHEMMTRLTLVQGSCRQLQAVEKRCRLAVVEEEVPWQVAVSPDDAGRTEL